MAPVRNYSNWNKRDADNIEQLEPYKKFFFICEGANTETWYFQKLVDLRKKLGIHPLIDICFLEKTEEDRDITYPIKLLKFADQQKKNEEIGFDMEHDKMIVVFDADIFETKVENYDEILRIALENGDILAVSNPAFELFLLLHFPESYSEIISPNQTEILKNEKGGNQTFIYKLLLEKCGMNCKKNSKIGELAQQIDIAIEQEKFLNQDITAVRGNLTCNIGKIIADIRNSTVPV